MCRLKRWPPGPEKLFDSGPDSGPENLFHSGPGFGPRKVVYHSVDTNVQIETVASKEPLEKHAQPRAPGCWISKWLIRAAC